MCGRREITALQTENYSLERQLFSYQKSMSVVQSRGTTYSDELDGTDGGVSVDDQPDHPQGGVAGVGGGPFYDDGASVSLNYPLPHHQHHHQQQHQQHHQLHHHQPLPPQQPHHHHP